MSALTAQIDSVLAVQCGQGNDISVSAGLIYDAAVSERFCVSDGDQQVIGNSILLQKGVSQILQVTLRILTNNWLTWSITSVSDSAGSTFDVAVGECFCVSNGVQQVIGNSVAETA